MIGGDELFGKAWTLGQWNQGCSYFACSAAFPQQIHVTPPNIQEILTWQAQPDTGKIKGVGNRQKHAQAKIFPNLSGWLEQIIWNYGLLMETIL